MEFFFLLFLSILATISGFSDSAQSKPKIEINDEYSKCVRVGEDIILSCTVEKLKIPFQINWNTPEKDHEKNNRVELGYSTRLSSSSGYRILTVRNVTKEDEGYYNCSVRKPNGSTYHTEKYIQVYDSNVSCIVLTARKNLSEITAKEGEKNVNFGVHVKAYKPLFLEWFDPKGKKIESNSTKYDINSETNQTTLIINNIQRNDAGKYLLTATQGEHKETINITLIVYDAPVVLIDNRLSYMHGESHNISCIVEGILVPNVTWQFEDTEQNLEKFSTKESKIMENVQRGKTLYTKITSILEIKVNESRNLTCSACNSFICVNKSMTLLATDIQNEFYSSVSPSYPVIGDNVTLSCAAYRHTYIGPITWYKRNATNNRDELILINQDYTVIQSNTSYSQRVDIEIRKISMSDEGTYVCKVRKTSNEYNEKAVSVKVQEIKKPVFVNTTMNGKEPYYAHIGTDVEWKCIARGIPKPSISWYKDDKFIEGNDQTLKISSVKVVDEGKYTCKVENRGGKIEGSVTLKLKGMGNNALLIGLFITGIFFAIIIAILALRNYKEMKLRKKLILHGMKHFEEGDIENINPDLGVNDQADLLPYDKKWEFPREKLKLGRKLGYGAFGVVLKAQAYGILEEGAETTVAVKMVKPNADYVHMKSLASELKVMVHLGKHLNVINLLGACTKNPTKRGLLVIVEFCKYGNLQNYLLRHRDSFLDQIDASTGKIVRGRGFEYQKHLNISISEDVEAAKSYPRVNYAALSFSSEGSMGNGGYSADYKATPISEIDEDSCISPSGQSINSGTSKTSSGGEWETKDSSEPFWRTNYTGVYNGEDIPPICTTDLISWAFQVARGMEYLVSRRVLHGDLAARNILLSEDNVVKICDFGLAKSMYKSDIYKKKEEVPLPVKWMAIESIQDMTFSTQSDVWSFGIVLWEFFSLARTPYPGIEADEWFVKKLIAGYRMEMPRYATEEIYSVMMDCWKKRPCERPTFTDLAEILGGMLEDGLKNYYLELNKPYANLNNQRSESLDYFRMMCEPTYANSVMVSASTEENCATPRIEEAEINYVAMSSPSATSEVGYESGSEYLSMIDKGNFIFSPRPKSSKVFDFDVSPSGQLSNMRSSEVTERSEVPECSPMLPATTAQEVLGVQNEDSLNSTAKTQIKISIFQNTDFDGKPKEVSPDIKRLNIPRTKALASVASSGFFSDVEESTYSEGMSPFATKER